MRDRTLAAIVAVSLFVAGCAPLEEGAAAPAVAAPRAAVTVLTRSSATITGQPLGVPREPWEVVISVSELPRGGLLPMHRHPWPRYVYVERGRIRVSYEEAGLVREFGAGEAVVEAIDQWHEGEVVGDAPVRLIVMDQLPPGQTNVVTR